MRRYEKHATSDQPGPGDWLIIEIRDDGRVRSVSPEHHSFLAHQAARGAVIEVPFVAPKPVQLSDEEKDRQVLAPVLQDYLFALARWDLLGHGTKAEAVAAVKASL